ncbi:sulfatase [Granulicella mallensis MP5ACTX8]|uniref:Sulfatase n=2 Tax=Granulicella mallensis TaxID=940614 RepID=G8NSM0_GRAMM|nr:sulfatase [Granulicella mallensis MP5ACTX8]
MKYKSTLLLCALAASGMSMSPALDAQAPDRSVLPIQPAPFRGTIRSSFTSSTGVPPPVIRPPEGAPNVLVVLMDDAGYGQCGTFGGLIPTPTLDALASSGLRYDRFHVTALCSPSRAALLTGRNHHAVGMGTITNLATDFPGYTGAIPKSAALLPQVLQMNGYATAAFGKWHLIPENEDTPSGPFDHWPTRQGFDEYYGFLNGETDQWFPELTSGTQPVEMIPPPGRRADFTLNEDLADHAIRWIKSEKSLAPDKPFFVYFAPGATHAPLQAPKMWIDMFRGKFDMGWDRYRELVFDRQKALGVIPADAKLTPRPKEIPAWDSLTPDQKKVAARLMEVFAGFMAQTDHEVGRVIQAIHDTGQFDNTLIFFIAGDNGASLEGGLNGTANGMAAINGVPESTDDVLKLLDQLGGPTTTPHYPVGWAWAGNTPFQWGKRIGSHLGGTRDPLVVSWPKGIHDHGGIREQFEDLTDVTPTILDAAHVPVPVEVNGVKQQRMDGISMLPTFASASAPGLRTRQYFEMLGNRAIYNDGWMAASSSGLLPWVYTNQPPPDPNSRPWELYHLSQDYSEADNVASQHPEKVAELATIFDAEAKKNNVYPLDPRFGGRQPRPEGRHFTYFTNTGHLYLSLTPAYENHSHKITAYLNIPSGGANGVLMADGSKNGGFSLFLKDGRPTYTYNYFKRHVTTLSSPQPLQPGRAKVTLEFASDGHGPGKGANVTLFVNDKPVAAGRLPETVKMAFSFEDTFDIGEDTASPVGDYEGPFPFTGTIEHIDLDIEP